MKPYKYLMLHCSATRFETIVDANWIRRAHLGPLDLPSGVQYMGKRYLSRAHLPNDLIGGKPIADLKGRGWSKVGYSLLIAKSTIEVLNKFNEDLWIDSGEVTNGAQGMNSSTRHICYAGGLSPDGKKAMDTRTDAQKWMMEEIIRQEIIRNPNVLICGHNQFSAKACPSFDTVKWLREIGIAEKNIYKK